MVLAALVVLASPPLAAECQCTVVVTLGDLTWTSNSTSTGACKKTTLWWLYRDEIQVGHKDCGITTTCTFEDTRSTACLRTGSHAVRLHCGCGKLGTDVHGNPICDFDSGDDATDFFVNTTPTVGVEVEGPDVTGEVQVTAPYAFPNTPNPGERDLELFADGFFRKGSSNELRSGTYTFEPLSTACWKQGPHEIKVVATACHQSDPLFKDQAVQQIQVDHDPEIDFRLVPRPDGKFDAVTDYFSRRPTRRTSASWTSGPSRRARSSASSTPRARGRGRRPSRATAARTACSSSRSMPARTSRRSTGWRCPGAPSRRA